MPIPNVFCGRVESVVSIGCVFHQGVLAATAFLGGRAGVGYAGTRTRCKPGLLLCSMVITALLGWGLGAKGLEQEP